MTRHRTITTESGEKVLNDYVRIDKNTFKRIKVAKDRYSIENSVIESEVVEAFTLFFVLNLRMDWKNNIITNMEILCKSLGRRLRAESYKNIQRSLEILQIANLIKLLNKKDYGKNDLIDINVPKSPTKEFVSIPCENEGFINLCYDKVDREREMKRRNRTTHIPFAVHCLLLVEKPDDSISFPVIKSKKYIAKELDLSESPIDSALNLLSEKGYIGIDHGNVINVDGESRRETNKYYLYSYSNPYDNSKFMTGKAKARAERKYKGNRIVKIQRILDNGITPCVFMGNYVADFFSIYNGDERSYKIVYIEKKEDLREQIEDKDGSYAFTERYLCFYFTNPQFMTAHQGYLLKFIEDNPQIKMILLADADKIIPAILSRMVCCLKDTHEKTDKIDTIMPVHTAYKRLMNTGKINSKGKILDYAKDNCPELLILEDGVSNYINRKIDMLISSLTNGKTYVDILYDESDILQKVSNDVKLISLVTRFDVQGNVDFEKIEHLI